MPQTAICSNVHQTLDVHLHALSQIAFDLTLRLNNRANAAEVVLAEILNPRVDADLRFFENRSRTRSADSVNICKADLCALMWRKIYTCNTSHLFLFPRQLTPAGPQHKQAFCNYFCLCLCLGLTQITRTTPLR